MIGGEGERDEEEEEGLERELAGRKAADLGGAFLLALSGIILELFCACQRCGERERRKREKRATKCDERF